MNVKCARCGREQPVRERAPGSTRSCLSCGAELGVPRRAGRPWWPWGLGAVLLCCPCVGGVAVVLPGWTPLVGKARARQSECKANLKALFTSQKAYQAEKDTFEPRLDAVGAFVERGNRYAYFAGPGPMEDRGGETRVGTKEAVAIGVDTLRHKKAEPLTFDRLPPEVASQVGRSGTCPGEDCAITLACVGNVDEDDTLDVWSISTKERKDRDGNPVPPGEPLVHVDDTQG